MVNESHAGDLLGAYVLEACSPEEARAVADHADDCADCAAEIAELRRPAEWLGASTARTPAPGLRDRVLAAARAARPAGGRSLTDFYRAQVAELDGLLAGLSLPLWQLPSRPHRSVRRLMMHLYGNDELVAAAAGLDTPPLGTGAPAADVHRRWRRQAGALIERMDRTDGRLLERPVRLAGRRVVERPLREALVQRGFETWIHAEDVRRVLHLPPRDPGAEQLADIVTFALRLLPGALAAAGRAHAGQAIHLVLTGPGGGTRTVALAPGARTDVVARIELPAAAFCRLLAGRISAPAVTVGGDTTAADDFLAVAATMGCD
ncbi:maleylpyruvate isomerase family mycothiol-dependent enzyme [Actinoplanes sp. RD1]|uniref:maleylpyruvate isomerase family mycothiol-dependent enzyme n=1 Tax=Actinoplanes sp. RD1 TaxID=3064538 RepID=UPI0027429111|nr:maleylpyruvate isomerase family mycothiol-dependent enzyme [Actinoplanes sp. RD1]